MKLPPTMQALVPGPTFVVAKGPAPAPAGAPAAAPAAAPVAAPAAAPTFAKKVELPSICKTQGKDCSSCTALAQCGWCALDKKCVDGTKLGPHKEQCLAYDFNFCVNMPCQARNTCTDCTTDRGCGWCAATNKCSGGDTKGPYIASNCAAGFAGKRKNWAHGLAAQKCPSDTPALHSSDLWRGLRKIMYKSQRRIARMSAKANAPYVAPPTKAPAPTPAPVFVMTTWFYPTTPAPKTTSTTVTTTTTTTTTTVTTLPPTTVKPVAPIKIVIAVDQNVKNGAHASNPVEKTVQATPAAAAKEEKKEGKDDKKEEKKDEKKAALPGIR